MEADVIHRIVAILAVASALVTRSIMPLGAQQLTPIGVSYQPALYWSLPYYIASEKGWWKEVGLEPRFSTFPSGAPQMAAAGSKSWDVGGTGSAPATLGAQRFDILTIGITNDESSGNAIMVRKDEAATIRGNPQSLRGKQLLLTTNSTGEYAALACLRKWSLGPKDMQIVNLNQQEIISAFATGTGALAGVWAPNIYTLEERTGAQLICSGKDVDVTIPGALVVRRAYAQQNPDHVAAYLAVYLRAIAWEKAHRDETIRLMKEFYQKTGVNLPEKYLAREIDTRPTFVLDQQLKLFERSAGASDVDKWFVALGEYLKSTGTLQEAPQPGSFATDEYLKRVADSPKLKAFAEGK
jgi:ABC-type nitrate/sulfonate/bicarbonate transport system substrate-binding protein